ncbi:hypothetical protein KEM52_004087, partial [Ascosphaera acerosa]
PSRADPGPRLRPPRRRQQARARHQERLLAAAQQLLAGPVHAPARAARRCRGDGRWRPCRHTITPADDEAARPGDRAVRQRPRAAGPGGLPGRLRGVPHHGRLVPIYLPL